MSEQGLIPGGLGGEASDPLEPSATRYLINLLREKLKVEADLPYEGLADDFTPGVPLNAGDTSDLFPFGFLPVIGDASTLEPPEGLDVWRETQKKSVDINFNYYLTEEILDLGKFLKGSRPETDLFEKTLNPVTIDTTALIARLGEMIDFGSLFALLPLLNDVPVIACSDIKPDEGDYRDINFDEIM
jgi:hypothetical protein